MCSIILIRGPKEQPSLIVAANRDERLDRPALGPELELSCPIPRIRPKDQSQGGTWIGINAMGVFAGITNRFMAPNEPTRQSRGQLPLMALEEPSARMAANRLSAVTATNYNAFHLVIADLKETWVVWSNGEKLERECITSDVYIVTESSYGAGPDLRRAYLAQEVDSLIKSAPSLLDALPELLGQSHEDSFAGPCVNLPAIGYGTRSSTLITWDTAPSLRGFRHTTTPPNHPNWVDHSSLMDKWR